MSNVTKQQFEASLLARAAYADLSEGMSVSSTQAALEAQGFKA